MHPEIVREAAQAAADALNAAAAQHRANLADPQWLAHRDQVLAEQDRAERERSAAFERLIATQAARRVAKTSDTPAE